MLTTRILGLIGLALTPALACQVYNLRELRIAHEAIARADAARQARSVAADLGEFGDAVRNTLAVVSREGSVARLEPAGCSAYLRDIADRVPGVFLFAAVGADGNVAGNSMRSPPGSYSLAGRGYFKEAMRTGGFAVGDFVRGIVSGRPTLQMALALPGQGPTPAGIVLASIDLDWLAGRLGSRLSAGTTLTVVDRKGVVLVRHPDGSDWLGRELPPVHAASMAGTPPAGEEREVVALDGKPRFVGLRRPPGAYEGLAVSVGIDRDAALADATAQARRETLQILFGLALAAAAALLAGRRFIREPIDRLARVATAWRDGRLDVRTGMTGTTEFGRLGGALDAMADALQRNEGSLRDEVARSRALQARQARMLHELNHRVKNTLAVVQSLARQAHRGEDGVRSLEGRILALSKTHDLLTRTEWTGAPLAEVLRNELSHYRTDPDTVVLDGPEVELPPPAVLALGMTFHELATNAAKYGALSVPGGRVRVSWEVAEAAGGGRELRLAWREAGGPASEPPARRGYGSRLIDAGITRELDGRIAFAYGADGLACEIAVPLKAAQPVASFEVEAA